MITPADVWCNSMSGRYCAYQEQFPPPRPPLEAGRMSTWNARSKSVIKFVGMVTDLSNPKIARILALRSAVDPGVRLRPAR